MHIGLVIPLEGYRFLMTATLGFLNRGRSFEYVIARHKNGGLRPSDDAPEFPEFLQWFHYCEYGMPPVNTIVVQTVLLRERQDATTVSPAFVARRWYL